MQIRFRGDYDKRMFSQGLSLLDRTSMVSRILRWSALGLALAVIGLGIYDWVDSGATGFEIGRLARHSLTAILLGYFYAAPHVTRWLNVSKLFSGRATRTMQGEADSQAITIRAGEGRTAVFPWERFFRKGARHQLLSLMTVDGSMALFHREFFESESDWSRFQRLVEQKVIEPK